jgi:hypothetical protein
MGMQQEKTSLDLILKHQCISQEVLVVVRLHRPQELVEKVVTVCSVVVAEVEVLEVTQLRVSVVLVVMDL